jgi:protein-tyrosine phosphatase
MQFNMKHIAGSLNVNITSIGKKRLLQGKATLVDLVMSEAGKEYLKNGNWVTAVVYDESTSDLEKAPSSHPVRLVMDCILKDGKQAFLLKGGLKEFTECYHKLSSDDGSSSPIPTSAIERINLMAENEKEMRAPPSACPLNTSITEVLPSLYLGNAMDAADGELLTSANIRYILNLTKTCPNYFLTDPDYKYKQIKIEDSCREDIKSIVEEAIQFIDLAKANNSAVLIHCQGGVSRSPTVTIAYIMHLNGLSLSDAYEFVKTRRPCIAPNLNFMGQLLEMEQATRTRSK